MLTNTPTYDQPTKYNNYRHNSREFGKECTEFGIEVEWSDKWWPEKSNIREETPQNRHPKLKRSLEGALEGNSGENWPIRKFRRTSGEIPANHGGYRHRRRLSRHDGSGGKTLVERSLSFDGECDKIPKLRDQKCKTPNSRDHFGT